MTPDTRASKLPRTLSTAAMVVVAAVFAFPFVWMLATSLKPTDEVFSTGTSLFGSRVEWENYSLVFSSVPFGLVIANSLMVAILGSVLTVIVSAFSAYAFARFSFKYKNHLFSLFIVTLVLPQEVLIIPLYLMMYEAGLVDSYFALIVPFAFGAFGAFLLRQFILAIPADFEDAARLDGAGSFRILISIYVPLLQSPLWVLGVFTFIEYWSSFLWPLIVINDPNKATIPLGLNMFLGQHGTEWGPLMAAALVATLPSIVLVYFLQKQLEKGALAGAFGGR